MAVDELPAAHPHTTPSYGTPIRLAPSAAAFRKVGPSPMHMQPKPAVTHVPATTVVGLPVGQSPGKGMLGQVSDLIFGW